MMVFKQAKIIVLQLSLFFFLLYAFTPSAFAGSHSLTKWEDGKFDLVISLGWKPTTADKTNLETVFKLFAQDVWGMTEKNHELRRLYVYTPDAANKAREWSKADIIFLKTADAANATVAGFTKAGGRIFVDDDLSDLNEVGHAMAHELGHYAYALYDEYKDNQGPKPGFPHTNDTPKNTIMNQHWTYQRLSTASDYTDDTKLQTAHYRMYGESAWETLITPVELDSLWSTLGYLGYKNTRYAFTDLQALATVPTITTPTPTDNPDVEIIWMEGSEVCVIIDRSGSMGSDSKMESAQSGAKSFLDKLAEDSTDYAAVVDFDDSVTTIGSLAQVTAAKKTEFKSAIDGLYARGGTYIGSALQSGLNILSASTRKGTYKYIVLLTDGQSSDYTGSVSASLYAANIPVFAIGLGSDADMSTLRSIASATGGQAYSAASSATLNAIYSNIQSLTSGDKLTARVKDNLNINKNSMSQTVMVDSTSTKATFSAGFDTGDTMEMTLTTPDGTTITASDVDNYDDITLTSESGYIYYTVDNPDTGEWTITVTATISDDTDHEVVVESKTDSDFSIDLIITGGTYPEPVLMAATVKRNYPITGLAVTAEVTDSSDNTTTITMKDDGVSPDTASGDGMYTGAMTGYSDGEYEIKVIASNSSGKAVETSDGVALKQGSSAVSNSISTDFEVVGTGTVTCSGVSYASDSDGFNYATYLTVDGNGVAEMIDDETDVDYFYFTAESGKSYTIYTSGLYPTTMKTLVKLYGNDQTTKIDEDDDNLDGISAKIIYEADTDGTYYITVEHPDDKTGTYTIAVRITQETDSKSQPQDDDTSGSKKSSGGGCFINSLM